MGSVGNVQPPALVAPPPGGVAGQYLVKNSSVDYAASWQTITVPVAAGPDYLQQVSGSYFSDNRSSMPVPIQGTYTSAPTASGTFYVPMWIPFTGVINQMGAYAQSYSSGGVSAAIMSTNPSGNPGSLLATGNMNGNGVGGFFGFYASLSVTPGWYWFAVGNAAWNNWYLYGGASIQFLRSPLPPNPSGPALTPEVGGFHYDPTKPQPTLGPTLTTYNYGYPPLIAYSRSA